MGESRPGAPCELDLVLITEILGIGIGRYLIKKKRIVVLKKFAAMVFNLGMKF